MNCNFNQSGKHTFVYTHRDFLKYNLKTLEESNDKDRIIVIDNSPMPQGGANVHDSIVLEYASSNTYAMTYNLRNVSIYMGIFTVVLLFAIGSLNYLAFKIQKDIKRKFQQDEDETSEDEDAEEDKEEEKEDDKAEGSSK
uniref:Uncharacterized protein n=1 Tax=Strombidium rassoulzadegani TaxID=1082188 RepID=A0A7S3CTX7_9SPIT|mmetsp:Transcript_9034/g.15282  ORF Transcript_9034/g.15282 Transcript_9034/m.15282 type:complete len:140 (+) Transcript_9034:319-738(+)